MRPLVHQDISTSPVPAPAPPVRADAAAWLARFRIPALAVYIVVSAIIVDSFGTPDRPYVLIWVIGGLCIACWRSPRPLARIVIDWLPVLVIAAGYDLVRDFAPDLVPRATFEPQLRFDEIVFGGTAPTVTLQNWLRPGRNPHWWDYLVFLFYLSHFVVTPAVAIYLYARDRVRFKRFACLILTVSLAGFATYFILPAAPPWLASREGDLQHTIRVVHSVWANLGADAPARAFNGATRFANPVAALPSLHAAWPFMAILFFWRTARRGRWVAVAYMAMMMFVLVYGSEHYVSDILLGWLYSAIVFVVVNRLLDKREAARAALDG